MTSETAVLISARGEVQVDLAVGNISKLVLRDEGRAIEPLHRAPWADDPLAEVDNTPPVERRLSGDFFCAPFGGYALPEAPLHGPAANSRWRHVTRSYNDWAAHPAMRMELVERVMGASVIKEVALGASAPLLFQSHVVAGGSGSLPASTHPMVRVAPGDRITVSPKMRLVTPATPIVAGRHLLRYPAASEDYSAFPGLGGTVDLGRVEAPNGTEDFVQLIEAPGRQLGWTAVTRRADVVFVLKDPRVLPVTQLWFSNGGRTDPPWNGRHTGVLGIEDARVPTGVPSIPEGLNLCDAGTHTVSHVIGAMIRPEGWRCVRRIDILGDDLILTGDDGTTRTMPFDKGFF